MNNELLCLVFFFRGNSGLSPRGPLFVTSMKLNINKSLNFCQIMYIIVLFFKRKTWIYNDELFILEFLEVSFSHRKEYFLLNFWTLSFHP